MLLRMVLPEIESPERPVPDSGCREGQVASSTEESRLLRTPIFWGRVTPRPVTGRKRSREAHCPLSSLARSLVGQIHGVYERGRDVLDLLAAKREVIERIPLDGKSVPVSLQVMEIEILREDQLPNEP
jgi:hypothetical protein